MGAGTRGALALVLAMRAMAQGWPTRTGESGLLDVPDGETLGLGGGALTLEMRYDRAEGSRGAFGPTPLALLLGLGGAELGLALREGGMPDDPRPSAPLFSTAFKLRLLRASPRRPAVAIGGLLDRANLDPSGAVRLAASMGSRRWRVAAFGGPGFDGEGSVHPTAGLAVALHGTETTEGVAQGLLRDEALILGAAARWRALRAVAFGVGGDVEPSSRALRISVSIAFIQAAPPRLRREAPEPTPEVAPTAEEEVPAGRPKFKDERPRFRLRIPKAGERKRPQHPAPPPPEPEPGGTLPEAALDRARAWTSLTGVKTVTVVAPVGGLAS